MSAYRCTECERILDSHDGCVEHPNNPYECICEDCAEKLQMEAEDRATERAQVNVGGHRNGGSAS